MEKNSSSNEKKGIKTTLLKTSNRNRRDNVHKPEHKKIKIKLRLQRSPVATGTTTNQKDIHIVQGSSKSSPDSRTSSNDTLSASRTTQPSKPEIQASDKKKENQNNTHENKHADKNNLAMQNKTLDQHASETKKTTSKMVRDVQHNVRSQQGGGQNSLLASRLQKIRNTARQQKIKTQATTTPSEEKPQNSRPVNAMGLNNPIANTGNTGRRSFKATRRRPTPIVQKREPLEKQLFLKTRKQTNAVVNPVPKSINIIENISIADLAKKMNIKASLLLSKLMSMGTMATLNSVIDSETASILAAEYDCTLTVVSLYEQTILEKPEVDKDSLHNRPPIVTIMGHVDHGKTQLLDTIRNTNVVATEHGKITQQIGAYQVTLAEKKITFLDTPGHAAFSMMRARGAKVTDLVLLVLAANDGVKEQTIEAISHIKDAGIPVIIVINKIDLIKPNTDTLYTQLTEQGLSPEEWGGDVMVCKVSALTGEGIPELLESITLQSELLDLKASDSIPASGTVLESKVEKGRGIVATLLIQDGTLRKGDYLLTGIYASKVRTMYDDRGNEQKIAGPSTPVEITGLEGLPKAGDPFQVTKDDKEAKTIASKRQELSRAQDAGVTNKITSDNLLTSIESDKMNEYKAIVKADTQGSAEAIKHALETLSDATIRIKVVQAVAGNINESDIMLASASDADVIGFNVSPTQKIQGIADREKVTLKKYSVIFEIIDEVKEKILALREPEYEDVKTAEVEVRELFVIPKKGMILGSYIRSGNVEKGNVVRVMRDGNELDLGTIITLQRFKDSVNKVEAGFECGIGLSHGENVQKGEELIIYTKQEISPRP